MQSFTFNGATSTITTDTLFVQEVKIDFLTGTIVAVIQKGTGVPFSPNLNSISVMVNPDGTFRSSDGMWAGSLGAAMATTIAQLKTTFDQFILASGQVTGTLE